MPTEPTIYRVETMAPPQSSVEITQNAKGAAQVTVKVYHADVGAAADLALATYQRTLAALAP